MSASEKLKAHGGIFRLTEVGAESSAWVEISFWPQIVAGVEAAVEAAEQARRYVTAARDSLDEDEMEDGEPSITAARLMAAEIVLAPALAALELALGDDYLVWRSK